jgi:hypothetical protein
LGIVLEKGKTDLTRILIRVLIDCFFYLLYYIWTLFQEESVVMAYTPIDEVDQFSDIPEAERNTFEVAFRAVSLDGENLYYLSENFKNNIEIVIAAVRQNGEALRHASENLQDNTLVVLIAILQNEHAFNFASPRLQANSRIRARAHLAPVDNTQNVIRPRIVADFWGDSSEEESLSGVNDDEEENPLIQIFFTPEISNMLHTGVEGAQRTVRIHARDDYDDYGNHGPSTPPPALR